MSKEFLSAKDKLFEVKSTLNISGNLVNLDEPQVMGILNITPDSFYAESRVNQETAILKKAHQMVEAGAFILDIGGYSTRPGADDISEKEETKRVTDAINLVRSKFSQILISIDTFRSSVAKHAIEAGANIINDVSGGNLDSNMFETVAQLNVPYILMHMRGTPQTMKSLNHKSKNQNLLSNITSLMKIPSRNGPNQLTKLLLHGKILAPKLCTMKISSSAEGTHCQMFCAALKHGLMIVPRKRNMN